MKSQNHNIGILDKVEWLQQRSYGPPEVKIFTVICLTNTEGNLSRVRHCSQHWWVSWWENRPTSLCLQSWHSYVLAISWINHQTWSTWLPGCPLVRFFYFVSKSLSSDDPSCVKQSRQIGLKEWDFPKLSWHRWSSSYHNKQHPLVEIQNPSSPAPPISVEYFCSVPVQDALHLGTGLGQLWTLSAEALSPLAARSRSRSRSMCSEAGPSAVSSEGMICFK